MSGTAQKAELGRLDGFEDVSAWAFNDMWNFDQDDFHPS